MDKIISNDVLLEIEDIFGVTTLPVEDFKVWYPKGEIHQNGIRLVVNEDKKTYDLMINNQLVHSVHESEAGLVRSKYIHAEGKETLLNIGPFRVSIHGETPRVNVLVNPDATHFKTFPGLISGTIGTYLSLAHRLKNKDENPFGDKFPRRGIAEWLLANYTNDYFDVVDNRSELMTEPYLASLSFKGPALLFWKWKEGTPRPDGIIDAFVFSVGMDNTIDGCMRGFLPDGGVDRHGSILARVAGCGRRFEETFSVPLLGPNEHEL